MRQSLLCATLLAALCGGAVAQDLASADAALQQHAYARAQQMYTALAAAGNATAQFHLGEMAWYGEGQAQDLAAARVWFSKAAAGGSREAGAALDVMRRHDLRADDITYWTTRYDGADLNSGAYGCAAPTIPARSTKTAEIKAMEAAYAAWQACYARTVANIKAVGAPIKHVPADLAALMNEQEYEAATAHVNQVFSTVVDKLASDASATMNAYAAWQKATTAYVTAENARTEAELAAFRAREQSEGTTLMGTPVAVPQLQRK